MLHLTGTQKTRDEIQYPVAHRQFEKCNAIRRIPWESKGAGRDFEIAKEK
jgi:hypothetical protein